LNLACTDVLTNCDHKPN